MGALIFAAQRTVCLFLCALFFSLAPARADIHPLEICARMDLLLLTLIEDAGNQQDVDPEYLLRTVESAMAARRLCATGAFTRAEATYRRLVINLGDR